jgi:hypothetical protein
MKPTPATLSWADIGDIRIGPLMRELIEALAESEDPHLVRNVAQRMRRLSSSLVCMSDDMAANHERKDCPLCKTGSPI